MNGKQTADIHINWVVLCTAHTPDNSFLGFIIPQAKLVNVTKKENYALIIGKEPQYLLVCHGYIFC